MLLLEIKNLQIHFNTDTGIVRAVDNVSISLERGEIAAIVGGSGSGKTILALSVIKLLPEAANIAGGEVLFHGRDLLKMSSAELRKIRGKNISFIFQEPMTSLNPVFTIESQITEAILAHDSSVSKTDASLKALELLRTVGIANAKDKLKCYPHELSGGERQRVMISIAISGSPDLLIADEPTTALDVTIQAQILELLKSLQKKLGMAVILITHDFGIVAEIASKVYVMHNGKIVEEGGVRAIFSAARNEYTKKLLAAVPVL